MSSDFSDQALRELVSDRKSLRIEVIPSAEITPIQAAWMMGRLCNELHFRLQRAWLFFPVDEPERTRQIWVDLAALIARIVDDLQAVSQTRTAIDRVKADWDSCIQSEWHSDEIEQGITVLGRHLGDEGEPLPHGLGEVDYLADLSRRAAETVNELELKFLTVLLEPARLAFQLGRIADQLIHPLLSSRVFRIQGTINSPVQLSSPWNWGDTTSVIRKNIRCNGLRLPDQSRVPWPDSEWRREIEHLHARFCQCTDQQATRLVASWTSKTLASKMLDELDACVYEAAHDVADPPRDPEGEKRHSSRWQRIAQQLGLTLTVSTKHIQTSECSAPRRLAPGHFQLLLFFLNRYGTPTPTEEIRASWTTINPRREGGISADSVRTQINQLNQELNGTGLGISSEGGGYRLTRIADGHIQ